MKYALIGCGRISTNHVKAVVNNKLEFVAACDVVPEHIENVLAKHGLENDTSIKRYTDYKKMIEENEIELVGIATESGLHAEIALYCIEHGINCIIEKPMAMSIEDADGFTGDTIGMYASSNGIESTAYADYEWFAYQAL